MAITYLSNAKIHTMNAEQGTASSLTLQDGWITAIGTDRLDPAQINTHAEVIDLGGRTVLPGLCDSHIHIEKYAQMIDQVDCETETLDECLKRVEERCSRTPPGEWIFGHGWNQNVWGNYGTLKELDAASPNHPVFLTAKSLHAGWANSRALALAKLSGETNDPPKGKLQRDLQGQLTGILFENAMPLISGVIPKAAPSTLAAMIQQAQHKLNRLGITAVHDFDGITCLAALSRLADSSQLHLRVLKHIREKDFPEAIKGDYRSQYHNDWIRIGHLKLFADGALGPRTAAMLTGYEGEPANVGMLQFTTSELVEIGSSAIEAGYPLAIHAIGDKANRTVLDAFEELRDSSAPYAHRIEHVQVLHETDVSRLSDLGVIASMQPIHALSDYVMADAHWGDRVRWSYAWNSQFRSGAQVIFGSDAPVESPDPWQGISAAVSRRPLGSKSETPAWIPEERVTVEEALLAYTANPAMNSPWQGLLGQLVPGFAADLIVLDHDPFELNAGEIAEIRPCGVMVDGKWVIQEF